MNRNLKTLRKRRKLTQEQLALLLHCTPQAVSKYERNGISDINVLAQLTEVLNFEITIRNGCIYYSYAEKEEVEMNKNTIKTNILEKYEKEYREQILNYIDFVVNNKPSITMEHKSKFVEEVFESLKIEETHTISSIKENMLISFETAVYEDDNYYFLDFRAFDEITDNIIDAYMMVYYKSDLSVYEGAGEIDDIWSWSDWKEV